MKRMAVLVLLALASGGVQADEGVSGWRAGVAASFGQFEGKDVAAEELGKDFIRDNSIGYRLYGQYRLNKWLGLEGAYHYSGNYEDRSTNPALPGKLELNFSGFSLQGLLYIPTAFEGFDAYVKAGIFDFDDELVVDGITNSNSSERGLAGGFGAVFHFSELIGFRVEYETYDADVGDLSAVNLGVEFSF